jgi:hypothetical protein
VHRNPHKRDKEATRAAKFLSRYSYVSFRIHPGTTHPCVYLAGSDCGAVRERIFQRDHFRCQLENCQICVSLATGELDHIEGKRKVIRCWCDENLRTVCKKHHRRKHNREPKWSFAVKPAPESEQQI